MYPRNAMPRIIIALLFALLVLPAAADTTITYQGQLQDNGQPFNGQVDLTFELFDDFDANDPSVGNSVAGPLTVNDVQVTDGLFRVDLDFGAVYEQPVWIEVTVDTDILHPRQRLTSAPVAVRALNVSSTAGAWMLGGNAGTDPANDFLGTTDSSPLELRVNDRAVTRVFDGTDDNGNHAPNLIAGSEHNVLDESGGSVSAATIAGGGGDPNIFSCGPDFNNPCVNTVSARLATVVGGYGNYATELAATAMGAQTTASGFASTAMGFDTIASGSKSMAMGRAAEAQHDGTFVWADDSAITAFSSTAPNQFLVRAAGGAEFQLGSNGLKAFSESGNTSGAAIQAESTHTSGIALVGRNDSDDATLVLNNRGTGSLIKSFTGGALLLELHNSGNMTIAGTLTENSDRNAKEAVQAVDNQQILQKLIDLDITTWRYKGSPKKIRHIGPMAQDFHALFGFGQSSTTITGMDVRGVALAAIQAMHEDNLAMKDRLDELEAKNAELQALAERNSELEQRLSALEALLVEGKSVVGVNQ